MGLTNDQLGLYGNEHDSMLGREAGFRVPLTGREPHVATPLDAWRVSDADGTSYVEASIRLAERRLADHEEASGIVTPAWLKDFISISLNAAITKRCVQNTEVLHRHNKNQFAIENDDLKDVFERAKVGDASPAELIWLVTELPTIPSVELAKLSHPFDWQTSLAMDTVVNTSINELDPNARWRGRGANPRHKLMRATREDNPRAIILTRKRDVASMWNRTLVVKRSSLVLRFDDEVSVPRQLQLAAKTWVSLAKQRDAKDSMDMAAKAVGGFVEEALALPYNQRPEWLLPTATSYYAIDLSHKTASSVPRAKLAVVS